MRCERNVADSTLIPQKRFRLSQARAAAMHNGASNEIKEIEVCKKCPKVEPYCVPIFDPITVKPFLDDAK